MLVFTGIVEEVGRVVEKSDLPDAVRLRINGPLVTSDASPGDSIAVNGVCLTVVEVLPGGEFITDVMAETLNRSTLRHVGARPDVNLERAVEDNEIGLDVVAAHGDFGVALSGDRGRIGQIGAQRLERQMLDFSLDREFQVCALDVAGGLGGLL